MAENKSAVIFNIPNGIVDQSSLEFIKMNQQFFGACSDIIFEEIDIFFLLPLPCMRANNNPEVKLDEEDEVPE